MAKPEEGMHERTAELTPVQKRRVVDCLGNRGEITRISDETSCELKDARAGDRRIRGTPGPELLRFAGIWTAEDADEIKSLITDEREKAEPEVR